METKNDIKEKLINDLEWDYGYAWRPSIPYDSEYCLLQPIKKTEGKWVAPVIEKTEIEQKDNFDQEYILIYKAVWSEKKFSEQHDETQLYNKNYGKIDEVYPIFCVSINQILNDTISKKMLNRMLKIN